MAQHHVLVSNKKVQVHVEGSGEPLLFVHGFPLDGRMWNAQVQAFSNTHQVIVPDLPGFGGSQLGDRDIMTPANVADVLAELLEVLQVTKPVTLCGLSMGGYIALEFWKRHPARLWRLIFAHTKATADSAEVIANRRRVAENAIQHGSAELASVMPTKMTSAKTQQTRPDVMEGLTEMMIQQSGPAIAAASLGMAARQDFVALLEQMHVPTLVIAGTDDALMPLKEMELLAQMIPHAKLIVIKDVGHLSPMEQPERFNTELQQFL